MASNSPAPPAPGGAIALTVLALTLANLVLAYLVAGAVGARPLDFPFLAVLALLGLSMLAAVGAVLQWRSYLRQSRQARSRTPTA